MATPPCCSGVLADSKAHASWEGGSKAWVHERRKKNMTRVDSIKHQNCLFELLIDRGVTFLAVLDG